MTEPTVQTGDTPLLELQEKALQTAQRFVDYESYQESESRAVSALFRRCNGWSRDDCRARFRRALAVHRAGVAFLHAHRAEAAAHYRTTDGQDCDIGPIAGDFIAAHDAAFPQPLVLGVLRWCFYWYHLR